MYRKRSKSPSYHRLSISTISSNVHEPDVSDSKKHHRLSIPLEYIQPPSDMNGTSQSSTLQPNEHHKRTRTRSHPDGTVPYIVTDNDTVEKVALHFDLTPSALMHLNKLNSRFIVPGQILYVPDKVASSLSQELETVAVISSPTTNETLSSSTQSNRNGDTLRLSTRNESIQDTSASFPLLHPPLPEDVGPMVWSIDKNTKARPGHVERLTNDLNSSKPTETNSQMHQHDHNQQTQTFTMPTSTDAHHSRDTETVHRFIKVNVRLKTEDHETVAGTLLVMPFGIMFDPDPRDPLVKYNNYAKYGLIIPMDHLVGISLYEDLAMFEREANFHDEEKRKMFYSTSLKTSSNSEKAIISNNNDDEIHGVMSELLDKVDKELDPSVSNDKCRVIFDAASCIHRQKSMLCPDENGSNGKCLQELADDLLFGDTASYENNQLQVLDEYKNSIGILFDKPIESEKPHLYETSSLISNVHDWTRFRRAIKDKPTWTLQNDVPLDQYKQRFDTIDELLRKQHENLKLSPIEIPYYLCIRAFVHEYEEPQTHGKHSKKKKIEKKDNTHHKIGIKHEYWFSVPKEKVDPLYTFFHHWTPELQSNPLIDDCNPSVNTDSAKQHNDSAKKGFLFLNSQECQINDKYETSQQHSKKNNKKNQQSDKQHYLSRQSSLLKDWEIISFDEIYRRIQPPDSSDTDDFSGVPSPTLLQTSSLINEEHSKQILLELPNRIHAQNWFLVFSTDAHGFSLNQLYRRSTELEHDSPSLLIVKDVEQNIFGAYSSHQLRISEGFIGTGESFLFTFHPEFQVFNWSGENDFFIKGDLRSIGFGSGEGAYGLWLDGDLYHGRTCATKTFNNEPLTTNEDFIIASVELWTFID